MPAHHPRFLVGRLASSLVPPCGSWSVRPRDAYGSLGIASSSSPLGSGIVNWVFGTLGASARFLSALGSGRVSELRWATKSAACRDCPAPGLTVNPGTSSTIRASRQISPGRSSNSSRATCPIRSVLNSSLGFSPWGRFSKAAFTRDQVEETDFAAYRNCQWAVVSADTRISTAVAPGSSAPTSPVPCHPRAAKGLTIGQPVRCAIGHAQYAVAVLVQRDRAAEVGHVLAVDQIVGVRPYRESGQLRIVAPPADQLAVALPERLIGLLRFHLGGHVREGQDLCGGIVEVNSYRVPSEV